MGLTDNIHSKERRKYTRYNAEGSIIIKADKEGIAAIKADLIDISFSGICVRTKEKIEPNTMIKFDLITKHWGEPIEAEGRVKHIANIGNTFKAGIEFININKAAIEAVLNNIQRFIAREKIKAIKLKHKHPQSGNFEYF